MTLTTRQKVLIPALLVALGVLGYQGFAMYQESNLHQQSDDVVNQKPVAVTLPESKLDQNSNELIFAQNTLKTGQPQGEPPQAQQPVVAPVMSQVPDVQPNVAQPQYTQAQYNYLRLVNEYQTLQLQEMIAQTKQQIATARLKTAQEASAVNQYANTSNGNGLTVDPYSIADLPPLPMSNTQTDNNPNGYRIVYTGQQQGRWNATLVKEGHYYDVIVGSNLNGQTVTSISDSSVNLSGQQGQNTIVSFYGEQALGNNIASNSSAPNLSTSIDPATIAAIKQEGQQIPAPNFAQANPVQTKPQVAIASTPVVSSAVKNSVAESTVAPVSQQQVKNPVTTESLSNPSLGVKVAKEPSVKNTAANISANNSKSNMLAMTDQSNKMSDQVPAIPITQTTATNNPPATPAVAIPAAATANSAASKAASSVQTSTAQAVSTNASTSKPAVAAGTTNLPTAQAAANVSAAKSSVSQPTAQASSGAYTIQYIADHERSAVVQFMQQNNLNNAKIYQFSKSNQTWYALVQGQYQTSKDANAALQQLPTSAKKWQPFVIKMHAIDHTLTSAG